MPKNIGNADRIVRLAVAAVVALLYIAGVLKGALAVILLIVAAILLVTAAVGTCPLYLLFGISTNKGK